MGCHFLLQGIFPTQGSNPGLPHCRQMLYHLSYQGSPNICISSVQFSSVTQLCLTLCGPMDCSTPGLPVHHQLLEFTQTHVESVMPSNHLILCLPLLLLPLIYPSIKVFSNESVLCQRTGGQRIRWPKYWSFSFSIIPSKENPGLISFRMDWLDLLAVSRVFSNTTVQNHQFFGAQLSL